MANCIVVCGPTASGKTHLGVKVALRCNGEIISADSRQVYRGMDIGTGKDREEYTTCEGTVPCHLIDITEPSFVYTLYHYQYDFHNAFKDITNRGKLPVIVGGSGLYLEAVLKNYSISSVPENAALRKELMKLHKDELKALLREENPALYDKTDISSAKRIVRAIEISRASQTEKKRHVTPQSIDPIILVMEWEREKLKERIETRLRKRLDSGMIEEVSSLMKRGMKPERLEMMGMEYRFICRFLLGKIDQDRMYNELKQSIFQLAKRQTTWFRGMKRRGLNTEPVKEASLREAKKIIEKFSFQTRQLYG